MINLHCQLGKFQIYDIYFVSVFHFFFIYLLFLLSFCLLNPVTADGQIVAQRQNPAVSTELLTEILSWKNEGATETDIVCHLQQRTVPPGYCCHTWCPGKPNMDKG